MSSHAFQASDLLRKAKRKRSPLPTKRARYVVSNSDPEEIVHHHKVSKGFSPFRSQGNSSPSESEKWRGNCLMRTRSQCLTEA